MQYALTAICDIGRVRSNNEDIFLIDSHLGRNREHSMVLAGGAAHLIALADGMGGHAKGEVASERTLALLQRARQEGKLPAGPGDHDALRSVLEGIHHTLQQEAAADPDRQLMGTTVVGLLLLGKGDLVRFHAGDSRLYRRRSGRLDQLTIDHTVQQEFRQAGADPSRVGGHLVTSCIGGGVELPRIDTAAEPPVEPGDRYLLCSDGLTDLVGNQRIADLLGSGDPSACAGALVAEANQGGGTDNITVIVVDVVDR